MKIPILHFLFILGLLLSSGTPLPAQNNDDCYEYLRERGKRRLAIDSFRTAINQFIAARSCLDKPENDDLDSLIFEAQERWVNELIDLQKLAQKSAADARKAQLSAETAQKKAEVLAQKVENDAIIIEISRLSLWAERLHQEEKFEDALYLSFLARQLAGKKVPPELLEIFGESVYGQYRKNIDLTDPSDQLCKVLFPPNGHRALAQTHDGKGTTLRLPEMNKIDLPFEEVTAIALSPVPPIQLTGHQDGSIRLWLNPATDSVSLREKGKTVEGALFSPDGQQVLTWSRDQEATLWEVSSRSYIPLSDLPAKVSGAVFSPDGTYLLLRLTNHTAGLWNTSGRQLALLQGHDHYLYSARFSPDGTRIVTASADQTARLWDLQGKLLQTMKHGQEVVKDAQFAPQGNLLLTRSLSNTIRLWNDKGQLWSELKHDGQVMSAVFSHDGQYILTSSMDCRAILWDRQGQNIQTFAGHKETVTNAVFSPDNQSILTTSRDGTARLFNRQGTLLMQLALDTDTPLPAQFALNGEQIVAARGQTGLQSCPVPEVIYQRMQHQPRSSSKERNIYERYKVPAFILDKLKNPIPSSTPYK